MEYALVDPPCSGSGIVKRMDEWIGGNKDVGRLGKLELGPNGPGRAQGGWAESVSKMPTFLYFLPKIPLFSHFSKLKNIINSLQNKYKINHNTIFSTIK